MDLKPLNLWGFGKRKIPVGESKYLFQYDRLESTMDTAKTIAASVDHSIIGIMTDYQTKGRGRRGGTWTAPPGSSLLITYVGPATPISEFNPNHLSFAAGLAVCRAVETVTEGDVIPGLKWPNDVMVDGRKLAGVLIEVCKDPEANTVTPLIGIGVNVNVPDFPQELSDISISIEQITGMLTDISNLETIVRVKLFEFIALPSERIVEDWSFRSVTRGWRYSVEIDGESKVGDAIGISASGGLILEIDGREFETLSATSQV